MPSLPKLKAHEWKKVCYAIIVERTTGGQFNSRFTLEVIGCGLTPEEAKQEAVNNFTWVFPYSPKTKDAAIQSISECGLDTAIRRTNVLNDSAIVMRYCDAKLYIYAHDRGYINLVCYYDGAYSGHLARYLRYVYKRDHDSEDSKPGKDGRRADAPRAKVGRKWGAYGDKLLREPRNTAGCDEGVNNKGT